MNCWDRGLDKSLFGTTTGTGLELGGFDGGATPAKKKNMAILKIRYTYKKWNQVKQEMCASQNMPVYINHQMV